LLIKASYGDKANVEIGRRLMTVRTSRKTVTFTQPFSLSGIDEEQPAGTYTVETDEELLPGVSFPAYPIFDSWGRREGVKAADFLGSGVVRAQNVVPRVE
jgi:hypothetical protein